MKNDLRKWIQLIEMVIVQDRAASDVDNKMRDLTIHLNPSNAEAISLITKAVEHSIRGFVRETDGFVVIWDAYLTDHSGADALLRSHAHGEWWPRFSVDSLAEFNAGMVRNYVERDDDDENGLGMSEKDWQNLPLQHLTRMLGQPPRFRPT